MQTDKTYADLLAWERDRVGLSGLPREWTPSNWTNDENDCAVFQSKAFFGDIRYYVVSQFYNDGARNGQIISAARPGALACFRWPGSDSNFDHIGLVTSWQDAGGNFHTIEANTSGPISGHQVAEKVRNVSSVVGFVYPQYATSSATDGDATPIPNKPTQEELDEMASTQNASIVRNYSRENHGVVAVGVIYPDGSAKICAPNEDVDAFLSAFIRTYRIQPYPGNEHGSTIRTTYPAQMNENEWNLFWGNFPGKIVGKWK